MVNNLQIIYLSWKTLVSDSVYPYFWLAVTVMRCMLVSLICEGSTDFVTKHLILFVNT